MNSLYMAKEKQTTQNGSSYVILQDGNNSFHVTMTHKDIIIYEHFTPTSLQELRDNISALEQEAISRNSPTESAIAHVK